MSKGKIAVQLVNTNTIDLGKPWTPSRSMHEKLAECTHLDIRVEGTCRNESLYLTTEEARDLVAYIEDALELVDNPMVFYERLGVRVPTEEG